MTNAKRDIMDLSADDASTAQPSPQARPMVTPETNAAFLSEFLNPSPEKAESAAATATSETLEPTASDDIASGPVELREHIIDALKEIYDPEIPVNIYELGLIYEVNVADDMSAEVIMTLTTPHCPVAESMPGEVELRVGSVPGVMSAEVKLVWDPPWDMSRMSDEARLELGLL